MLWTAVNPVRRRSVAAYVRAEYWSATHPVSQPAQPIKAAMARPTTVDAFATKCHRLVKMKRDDYRHRRPPTCH